MKSKGIENLLFNALKISKKDNVLVIFEPERKDVADEASSRLSSKGIFHKKLLIPNYNGRVLPKKLSIEILSPENNVIIFFFIKSVWHQPERKKAKYELMNGGLATIKPEIMGLLTTDLKKFFENIVGKALKITSGDSKIEAKIGKVFYEDGIYDRPGSGGNFPAGEISFGFEERTASGHIKANIKTKYLGVPKKGEEPEFDVASDRLRNIKSDSLLSLVKKNKELGWLGEIGFGILPNKSISKEKDSIIEEKIIGTAHVGLGSNVSFGGTRGGMHMDMVFGPVDIEIGEETLMRNGKLNAKMLSVKTKEVYKTYVFEELDIF